MFYITGYQIFIAYFNTQVEARLTLELNENKYNEAELLELKVPLQSPYYTGIDEYKRVDGQFELNGIVYNYVKRKIYSDTLYLQYIPNQGATVLLSKKNILNQQAGETPLGKEAQKSLLKKVSAFQQFCQQPVLFNHPFFNFIDEQFNLFLPNNIPSLPLNRKDKPPKYTFLFQA